MHNATDDAWSGSAVDAGLLAEALVFYGTVIVMGHQGVLGDLIQAHSGRPGSPSLRKGT